jgi:uncharacterized membrane protein
VSKTGGQRRGNRRYLSTLAIIAIIATFAALALAASSCASLPPRAFRCLGQEPFWNVTISTVSEEIIYTTPTTQQTWKRNAIVLVEGTVNCKATTGDGQSVNITLRKELCSDTMSEKQYGYSATLELGGKTLRGCAEELTAR